MQCSMATALARVMALLLLATAAWSAAIETIDGQSLVHYGFKTDNGQTRTEDIKYNATDTADGSYRNSDGSVKKDERKSVEYKGGYSFISADGYEYTVLYKANKNGFHPYVTAKKVKDA